MTSRQYVSPKRGAKARATRAAIRRTVHAIGAPPQATADATAMLLGLSGADASWPLHDHGLALERIPDVIANTVQLIVDQLRAKVGKGSRGTDRRTA